MQSTRSVEDIEMSARPAADPIQTAEKARVEGPSNSWTRSVALEPGTDVVVPELELGVRLADLSRDNPMRIPCHVVQCEVSWNEPVDKVCRNKGERQAAIVLELI